ncbi:hypothetical protein ABZ918_15835, partial [Streptomyces viridosporus]|uniref:hypothetical protein n=1 Tax=Streptomyces viridosporus TaxID=67581 RepID=UPI00342B9739
DRAITHALIPPAALATVPAMELPDFTTLIVGGPRIRGGAPCQARPQLLTSPIFGAGSYW